MIRCCNNGNHYFDTRFKKYIFYCAACVYLDGVKYVKYISVCLCCIHIMHTYKLCEWVYTVVHDIKHICI